MNQNKTTKRQTLQQNKTYTTKKTNQQKTANTLKLGGGFKPQTQITTKLKKTDKNKNSNQL